MEITHRAFHRVDLVTVSGRLDAASAPELQTLLDSLIQAGRCRIVLDLAHLEHLSSAGLRVLTNARKAARAWKLTDLEGGDVRIATLSPRLQEVFDMTGMSGLFEIYPDTTAAVGSF